MYRSRTVKPMYNVPIYVQIVQPLILSNKSICKYVASVQSPDLCSQTTYKCTNVRPAPPRPDCKSIVMTVTILTILPCSAAFPPDPTCQLQVLRHDSNSLGMDSTQVCILKQPYEIGFSSLLKSQHCIVLELAISLEILSNFTH